MLTLLPMTTIPEHPLPDFDEALEYIANNLDDCLADIRDFRAAMALSDSPEIVVSEYQKRRLLRRLPEDAAIN